MQMDEADLSLSTPKVNLLVRVRAEQVTTTQRSSFTYRSKSCEYPLTTEPGQIRLKVRLGHLRHIGWRMKIITLQEQPSAFGYAFTQSTFARSTNAHNHNHGRLRYPEILNGRPTSTSWLMVEGSLSSTELFA